ncbi:rho GTPase-activating protein 29-like [Erinaceus europaeus]|uniref:Rho GTPase-activating protein 29-like n=1 Tax=Erinaceus europaeus TaxID=9365 RepID=A0ABM3YAJ6_ERIEU|nr:rho GTPase-activating protein 29-like [Erinaceus europaeus]
MFVICGHQKRNFKARMMGVDFNKFAREEPDGIPSIMKIFTSEIETHFLSTQGIYRIPGCPLNEKKICRALKKSLHFIDFSQFSEYDICDVLKLYLAKLPEPFTSFKLYSKFSELALEIKREKEGKHNKLYDSKGRRGKLISKQINLTILKMKEVLRQLPPVNFNCFHYIITHLKRVADRCHENEVSPEYIGLIFGPILFRTKVLKVSITNFPLLEYANEEILLEFILIYSDRIFDKALQPTKPLFTPEGDNFVDSKNTIFQQPMSVEKPENKQDTLEEYNKCPTEDIVNLSAEEQLDNASVKLINGCDSSLELISPASDSSVELISPASDSSVELISPASDSSVELISPTSDSSLEFISPANDSTPERISPASDSSLDLISSASDTKSNKGHNSRIKRSIKSFFSSWIGKFKKKKN